MSKIKEVLAPAGSMEALRAALANGADAVYLGGKAFSARASASNFDLAEIKEALTLAHAQGAKIHQAINILISQEEMGQALDYVHQVYQAGVDALIVQDLGLASLIRRNFPDLEIHASTQMAVLDLEGALFLKERGFSRVVVGRETPLDEVKNIVDNSGLEVEVFAHGALCVSISGLCLMSSFIGGRSGNRGACAQPCRKSYDLVSLDGDKDLGQGYLISPKDLMTLDRVRDWEEAGVTSLKLEGRMKRPDYVAAVTRAYRAAVDGRDFNKETLAQAFNRGFTQGLTFGDFGHDYASPDRPDNRGVPVGRLEGLRAKEALIQLDKDLAKEDLLEFDTPGGRKTFQVPGPIKKGRLRINLGFEPSPGSQVRRIISQAQVQTMEYSYKEGEGKFPLKARLVLEPGKPARLSLTGNKTLEVQGQAQVQQAKKAPLTHARVFESLAKFGESAFYLEELDLEVPDPQGAFLPIKDLNSLRRRALAAYEEAYQGPRKGKESLGLSLSKKGAKRSKTPLLSVEVPSPDLLERLDLGLVDRVYLSDLDQAPACLDLLDNFDGQVYISLPKVYSMDDLRCRLAQLKTRPHGLLVQTYGQVQAFRGAYPLHLGQGLNIFNSWSLDGLMEDEDDFTPSLELRKEGLQDLARDFSSPGIVKVYGHQVLMSMVHCPMSLIKGCEEPRPCKTCPLSQGYGLRDRRGALFPLVRQGGGTYLFNSLPTYLGGEIDSVLAMGPQGLFLSFNFEKEPLEAVTQAFYQALNGNFSPLEDLDRLMQEEGHTKGHYKRGIL